MVASLSAARLRELFQYDSEPGIFRRLVTVRGRRAYAGAVAGCLNERGYRNIAVDGRLYKTSRLAFLWVEGRWPRRLMDHINRDRGDDCWCNLREATPSQNQANRGVAINNTSGIKGVSWDRSRNLWLANIRVGYKIRKLGRFATKTDAAVAYARAANEAFGVFARPT